MTTTIALITGANKGIGLETARQLGARGMTVLAGARDEARGLEAERALRDGGADARFVRLDVTDPKSAQEAADWVDHHYGRLDILVNTAAIARAGGPPSQTDLDAMREVYETNVCGVIIGDERDAAAAAPGARRADRQRVERGGLDRLDDRPGQPPGADAGQPGLPVVEERAQHDHRALREGTARTPVKVNAANPGYTATDLNRHNGFRSVAEGAEASVHLATLDADDPSGSLGGHLWTAGGPSDAYGPLPW
jgi:Dehydrogenases with different specificities (related to short-chain alcohol dehydrogenases)